MSRTGKKEQDKLDVLLDNAFLLFIENGFSATTTNMIASKCMISKREIYKFFPEKKDLYMAVVARNADKVLDIPQQHETMTMQDGLIKIFHLENDSWVDKENERYKFLTMLLKDGIEHPDIFDAMYASGVIHHRERLLNWMEAQIAAGQLAPQSPEKLGVICSMIMDVVFGALTPKRRARDDFPSRKKHIIAALDIILKGINVN
ncbi:TetR/AcrR family transcriptional regulator [Erwiniaceae bacterium L1_54_6]|nr:TetR/AcrR family transcriptional regulator [Erwiniaceae bacterium L1_54_6]